MTPQEHEQFERLSPHIMRALARSGGTHSLEDVRNALIAHHAQIWWGSNSVIITQIEHTPQKRVLHFWLAGGDIDELETMYPLIAEWGRSIGCHRAVIVGRKGWERSFLREHGWRATHTVYEKEMTNG